MSPIVGYLSSLKLACGTRLGYGLLLNPTRLLLRLILLPSLLSRIPIMLLAFGCIASLLRVYLAQILLLCFLSPVGFNLLEAFANQVELDLRHLCCGYSCVATRLQITFQLSLEPPTSHKRLVLVNCSLGDELGVAHVTPDGCGVGGSDLLLSAHTTVYRASILTGLQPIVLWVEATFTLVKVSLRPARSPIIVVIQHL